MTWAITGMGLVSSLGPDTTSSLRSFNAGRTSVHPLRSFDPSRYRVTNAYELVEHDASPVGRPGRWLGRAIAEALAQAGMTEATGPRIPVLVGTGLAEQRSLELWSTGNAEVTLDELHFTRTVRAATGLTHTVTIVNACAASLFALALATDLLSLEEADAVVVAGTDALSESMFGLLDRVNARPPTEVRPFDVNRVGVILGEGAAAVVVEPLAHALARGAAPLATLRGVGTSCDAHHVTAPLCQGIVSAFHDAHRRASVAPDAIDLVFAHGTGTILNDDTEARALAEVFAHTRRRPSITALKSLIGHTSGASGLMSLITAVHSLTGGRIPPTRHHREPIDAIRDFPVITKPTSDASLGTVQINAFGFGGVNAVAVVDRQRPTVPAPVAAPRHDIAITGVGFEIPGAADAAQLIDHAVTGRRLTPAPFDPRATLGERGLRYKDRATLLGLCAAVKALEAAGWAKGTGVPDPSSCGVVVCTELGLVDTVAKVVSTIHEDSVIRCGPMDLPNVSGNVTAAHIAIWCGLRGLNLTVTAGATSGVEGLRHAAMAIRAGRATRMIVVGVEPADPTVTRLLAATAARHGDDPARLRAFDGAAAVVLEAAPAARDRGANAYAYLDGYMCTEQVPNHEAPDTMWFAPCDQHRRDRVSASGPRHVVTLSRALGEASAALGVLQCATAATLVAGGPAKRILVSAGGCWGAPYASMTLEARL
ncbi:MAG TPA: beta-ketoacyl synthase N-terminal-like domain-containing protein [Candidatus Limnocylindrales bacterium]|nr:beta-ketoacyl synthase N-terminal-like domain-containing protein [Candidatus Limnocylindrales bacterium]